LARPDPTDSIADQAAGWAVDMAYGDMTAESRSALDAWLTADPRHRGAYVRACAGLYAMEDAVIQAAPASAAAAATSSNDNEWQPARRSFARRVMPMAGGMALAASLAAFIVTGLPPTPPAPTRIATARILNLSDGSVATLQPGARIAFAVADGTRTVTLLSGEARFQVAKDKVHPFVVRSGDVYAQATGTVYSVGRVGTTGGTVRVSEGSVLVWPRDDRDQAIVLRAGGTLTLDPALPRPKAAAPAPAPLPLPALAQISLDNVPVAAAVARFNRVNSRRIRIADPAIGNIRIVGLFRADDPEQFAKAVAALSDARIEYHKDVIVIKVK